MTTTFPSSNLEKNRQDGVHQIASRKESILDAAEAVFLQKGLENTSMVDIASEAGITKVTLYRYFPDRHPIAFEIAVRMLRRIFAASGEEALELSPLNLKRFALGMIDHFDQLRDAYRYIGMFDHLYGDRYPTEALARWYKENMMTIGWIEPLFQGSEEAFPHREEMIALFNTIMSFLEKMAARGELMSAEQGTTLENQLRNFRVFIEGYFDR
jgi:AcrR family transcriptional regulator